jgi:tetratricopeptide (TPR) repeat protein
VNGELTVTSDNPDFHNNKGDALCRLEKYEEALKEYDIAIQLNANNSAYHNNKGNALKMLNRFEDAGEEYEIGN